MLDQALQVADVVARAHARAEGRAADVDGVGAMVDGFDADVCVARRREQFELVGQERHGARLSQPGTLPGNSGFN
ncbi:hypothetical protein D3C87_2121160 [compost metagenome]